MSTQRSPTVERYSRFFMALLRPRRANGGWVHVEDLAEEANIDRSTAYRMLAYMETAGFVIERDTPPRGEPTLGVRSVYVLANVGLDTARSTRARIGRMKDERVERVQA